MILAREKDECRYEYLSPAELAERLAAKAILYLPIGSLEWHNEHLPLGTDTLHAIELAHRLCRAIGGVVLPAYWWNTGGCHDHASTYHMPEAQYRPALKCMVVGLRPIPAKLLVLINGHGGGYQKETPAILAAELNGEGFPMRVVPADPYGLATQSACRIDHADTGETSVSLELIPQLVRLGRPIGPDLFTKKPPFHARGPATQAGGRKLWEAYLADAQALLAKEYAAAGG